MCAILIIVTRDEKDRTNIKTVRCRLYEVRIKKSLSLSRVAELTGVSISTLNKIENNKIYPTIYTLEQIARGLNVKIQELIVSDFI